MTDTAFLEGLLVKREEEIAALLERLNDLERQNEQLRRTLSYLSSGRKVQVPAL